MSRAEIHGQPQGLSYSRDWAHLVRHHRPAVYRTCLRLLGNRADAEDVTQECFEILAKTTSLPDANSLGAWLHGVATNRSLMHLRSSRRRRVRESTYSSEQPDRVDRCWNDLTYDVDEALASLPDELRVPLVRHFFQGESHREVGRSLGLPSRTVGDRIQRGIERIRKHLRRKGIEVGSAALAIMLHERVLLGAPLSAALALRLHHVGSRATPRSFLRSAGGAGLLRGTLGKVAVVAILLALYVAAIRPAISTETDALNAPAIGDKSSAAERPGNAKPARIDFFSAHPAIGVPSSASADEIVVFNEVPAQNDAELGMSAAILDDVTGDGMPDVILGAPHASRGAGYEASGRALVFDGATGRAARYIDTPTPEPRCNEQDCNGSGWFGKAVTTIQDINGNDYREIVVGAKDERVGDYLAAGKIYYFDSLTGEHLKTLVTPNPQRFANLGSSLSTLPDVTGDGVDEIIAGAEQESPHGVNAAGRAYIIDGAEGTFLHALESPDILDCHVFGAIVSAVPDVDGDGCADVVVGQGSRGVGGAHLFSGSTGTLLRSFRSTGPAEGGFGQRVLGIPDCDNDGAGDVMISHLPSLSSDALEEGVVDIVSGATGKVLVRLAPPRGIRGIHFGASLAYHSDFTGDGVPDYLIGWERRDRRVKGSGAVCVFNSTDFAFEGAVGAPVAARADGVSGFAAFSILPVPDMNGDGLDEVLVTAPSNNRSYLYCSPLAGHCPTYASAGRAGATDGEPRVFATATAATTVSETSLGAPWRHASTESGEPPVLRRMEAYVRRAAARIFSWGEEGASGSEGSAVDAISEAHHKPTDILGCRPLTLENR